MALAVRCPIELFVKMITRFPASTPYLFKYPETAVASITPGRSLLGKIRGRSSAPVAMIVLFDRTFQKRKRGVRSPVRVGASRSVSIIVTKPSSYRPMTVVLGATVTLGSEASSFIACLAHS